MTFFEKELRKIVGSVYPDAKYVGRAAYVPLGGDNVAKFEFVTQGIADHYTALRVQAVSKTQGVLDTTAVRFADVFAEKRLPMGKTPYAWIDGDNAAWYGFTPTRADYDSLTAAVRDYTSLFERPHMEQGGGMRQEMSM